MSDGGEADAAPRAAKKMRVGSVEGEGGVARAFPPRAPRANTLGVWADDPAPVLSPAWLVKSALPLPAGHPSPGALQGCRVALQTPRGDGFLRAYVASGARIYLHELPEPVAAAPQRGKEGVLVAGACSAGRTTPLAHVPARAELQALDCAPCGDAPDAEALLAAVDAYGHVALLRARGADADAPLGALAAATCLAPRSPSVEPSWAGVALAPGAPHMLATARHLARAVDIYDGDLHARCIHTPSYPAALTFLPACGAAHGPGTLLALAEANHVSVWDVRSGGCASRFGGASPAPLHALAAAMAPDGGAAGLCMLAAVGAERTLVVYDARSARPVRTLPSLMRKDITALRFSPADARFVFAGSIDYELQCRRWDGEAARGAPGGRGSNASGAGGGFAFRGEARWAGLATAGCHVAAFCASGALYAASVVATAAGAASAAESEAAHDAAAADAAPAAAALDDVFDD